MIMFLNKWRESEPWHVSLVEMKMYVVLYEETACER